MIYPQPETFSNSIKEQGSKKSSCDTLRRMDNPSERLRLRLSEEGLFILRASFVTPSYMANLFALWYIFMESLRKHNDFTS